MIVHSADCRYPECAGVSHTEDPDFAARLAYLADMNDGLVRNPVPWRELSPEERDEYRRAVQGLARQGAVQHIEYERAKQVRKGFSGPHDDRHTDQELVTVAIAYAVLAVMQQTRADAADALDGHPPLTELGWPAGEWTWLPERTPTENLIKAGALIAAEIDRLTRVRGVLSG